MPVYSYRCTCCNFEFDEFRNMSEKSGKSNCQKCGNTAFKIPAVFAVNIFKKREFADGTSTPDFVSTPKQEKAWLRSQGITYDAPSVRKSDVQRERKKRSETIMEAAFRKANEKVNQGYRLENQKQREVKNYDNISRLA